MRRPGSTWRICAGLAAGLLLATAVAACGFAPAWRQPAAVPVAGATTRPIILVAEPALADAAAAALSGVGLDAVDGGVDGAPQLELEAREERYGLRGDRAATRAAVRIAGTLSWTAPAGRTFSDELLAVVPYDIVRSDFAAEMARRDAERRALQELAQRVRATLARWRTQRSPDR